MKSLEDYEWRYILCLCFVFAFSDSFHFLTFLETLKRFGSFEPDWRRSLNLLWDADTLVSWRLGPALHCQEPVLTKNKCSNIIGHGSYAKGRTHKGKVRNPKPESVWCAHCRGANIATLKWQRSLWEGDPEAVKRSGRDEPIWVVIYICMEAMLGISLYSYSYLKLAKTLCLSYCCLCFLFKIGEEGRTGSAWKQGVGGKGEKWPKQCMHIW
jgi:hypothetical protein